MRLIDTLEKFLSLTVQFAVFVTFHFLNVGVSHVMAHIFLSSPSYEGQRELTLNMNANSEVEAFLCSLIFTMCKGEKAEFFVKVLLAIEILIF